MNAYPPLPVITKDAKPESMPSWSGTFAPVSTPRRPRTLRTSTLRRDR
jgi:hypothetical protein